MLVAHLEGAALNIDHIERYAIGIETLILRNVIS